jgi:hypothetical protein
MRIAARYELAEEWRDRYLRAGRKEKGEILDAFCLATGYHRKYALTVLRGGPWRKPRLVRRERRRRYGREFQQALRQPVGPTTTPTGSGGGSSSRRRRSRRAAAPGEQQQVGGCR